MSGLTPALVAAAATLGSVHTLAPDHWMPFAALAKAEGWTARRTALITACCGFGHVTGSVALGLVSVLLGLELLQRFGHQLERVSGLVLIAFGVVYGTWGLHRAVRSRWHSHQHGHTHWHRGGGHPAHHEQVPGSRTDDGRHCGRPQGSGAHPQALRQGDVGEPPGGGDRHCPGG